MGNIKILDCTLTATEIYFDKKQTKNVLKGLSQSGVDVIEVGLICDKRDRISENIFYSSNDLDKFIDEYDSIIEDEKISLLVDTSKLPDEEIEFNKKWTIRVQIWNDNLNYGLKYAKQLCDDGNRVIIVPMDVELYSDQKFEQIINAAININANGIYVTNYYGRMTEKCAESYIIKLDSLLPETMVIGYHTKDLAGNGCENIKHIFKLNLKHNIQVDTSVCGVSKVASNIRSEVFADYLNIHKKSTYNRSGFLYVYDHAMHNIYHERFLVYYLSSIHNCTHKYAEYYFNEIGTTLEYCDAVLERIPVDEKWDFDKKRAYEHFRKYIKTQFDMALVIPTCNRSKAIDSLLFQSAYQLRKYGIDIIVYDSSEDGKTESVTRNFQIDGCYNVIYKKYNGEFDGFSLDHKVMQAYIDFADEYKYIWVCRDGLIISIDACYDKLREYVQDNYECIIVDAKFRNDDEESENKYTSNLDCVDFLANEGERITVLGTLIFSADLMKRIIKKYNIDDKTYGLWVMAAPFHYFADTPFKTVSYIGEVFFYNNAGTSNSFWNKAGMAMEQWCKRWFDIIDKMPEQYNNAKKEVMKIDMFDFHPFYVNSLMRMRGNGGLTPSIVKKYKQYIPFVCNTAIWKFYLVSVMPKFLAKYLSNNQGGRAFKFLRSFYLLGQSDK